MKKRVKEDPSNQSQKHQDSRAFLGNSPFLDNQDFIVDDILHFETLLQCQHGNQIIKPCLTILSSSLVLSFLFGKFIFTQCLTFTCWYNISNPAPYLNIILNFHNQNKIIQLMFYNVIPKSLFPTFSKSAQSSRITDVTNHMENAQNVVFKLNNMKFICIH